MPVNPRLVTPRLRMIVESVLRRYRTPPTPPSNSRSPADYFSLYAATTASTSRWDLASVSTGYGRHSAWDTINPLNDA